MKKTKLTKRMLSIFISLLMVVGCISPALTAFAKDDGVIGVYDIQIFYEDGNLVPTYGDDNETPYIEHMVEGDKVQYTYQFIDCSLPDNGYVKWTSDTPTVCDVTEDGIVRAFDSSKGAAVRLWLDNEVGTIPLVGSVMKKALEKVLFNDYVDLDTMDTDGICSLVEEAFGSDSILAKWADSYKGELIDSLRTYLDKVNTVISCILYDGNGKELSRDSFEVAVSRSTEIYSDFIPNGTHITNKQDLPTTVAKGSTLQLSACTTPTRLHMGVIYTVKSSSIFTDGKVIATVDDSGLITFKNTGKVTILVSPDTEGFIENLLKYVNYIYALDNTGLVDSTKVADVLIKYVGLDINREVLSALLDTCFAIKDIVGDTADPVQLSATAIKIIANIILQFTTNDTITFDVVDGVPCTDFEIDGTTSVKEGNQMQLSIANAQPTAADTSDITWTSSDPSIASVDPETGIITGRDAGGSLGSLSQQTVDITATSAANNVSKTVTITVTGKTGRYLSDAEVIPTKESISIGDDETLNYQIYPARVQKSDYLYLHWGIVTAGSSSDDYEYAWAEAPSTVTNEDGTTTEKDGTVTDGIGKIDYLGHYYATSGGVCKVALRAETGYYLSDGSFYQISEVITTYDIFNGQPVTGISIYAKDVTSGGTLTKTDVDVDGKTYHYATVKKTVADGYWGNGCVVQANIEPENATNKALTWYLEGSNDFYLDKQDDAAGTVEVKMKAAVESADSVNVYCVSKDGEIKSDVLTICVTRNYATGNVINADSITINKEEEKTVTHTMSFSGSWTAGAYACYDCNWYSSDEDVFTVKNAGNDNSDAVITGVDVGTATLYCVSADGGILDSCEVTIHPEKSYLQEIVDLCESTVIIKTTENAAAYKKYMRKLDYAYYILNEKEMASQDTCDTYAKDLLYAFYQLGGYVGLNGIALLDKDGNDAGDYISCNVSTTSYKKTSYDLGYELLPKNCMYRAITWESSNSSVSVDKNGVCTPSGNSACYSTITVTAEDYMGSKYSDSVIVAFGKTSATGVSISPSSIVGGKAGETTTLKASVAPTGTLGIGGASVGDVTWKSSDEGVATVDASGLVTFVYGGDCVITATTMDGGYTASIDVNVITNYDALQELVNTYTSISLSPANYFPESYNKYQSALAEATQMIADNKSSQNEVNAMCEKLSSAYNGLEKYNYITKVELYQDGEPTSDFYQFNLSLLKEGISYTNATLDLNVRLYPNNASYKTVSWESSTDLITVTDNGVCSPTKNESCYGKITCTVEDHFGNTWSDFVWVSFAYYPVTGITLSDETINGNPGDTKQLTATIAPTGTSLTHIGKASIQDVYWESDDENIATVDEKGLVTFVNTGATTIRVVSYDGGINAECKVSTEGDRTALKAYLEQFKDINYTDYEYNYGMAFKEAYENANTALADSALSQEGIDAAATALANAGNALQYHPFVFIDTVDLSYNNYSGSTLKSSGSMSSDAKAYSLEAYSSGYTQNTKATIIASIPQNAAAGYKSITWSINDASENTNCVISGNSVSVNPSATSTIVPCSRSAKCSLTVTAVDLYGRTVSRTIRVVVAKSTVDSISLDKNDVTQYVTNGAFTLTSAVSPSDVNVAEVQWSSSNTDVATVDQNGVVTPVNTGSCTIYAESYDGGYIASCNVTLNTYFEDLATLYSNYNNFVNDVKEEHQYTMASLGVLQQTLIDANALLLESTAKQTEVQAMIDKLNNAYNNLVPYVGITGINVTAVDGQDGVTSANAGHITYKGTSFSGVSIKLNAETLPADSTYETLKWTSSSSDILVTDEGVVSKSSALTPGYAKITCTATDDEGTIVSSSVYVSFVRIIATGVSFSDEMVYGAPTETTQLNPTITTGSTTAVASVRDCIYESSDPEIASVDAKGIVTFNKQGEVTITVTTIDGGYTATILAHTTWDTTALFAAINDYSDVLYTDYAYEYGTAFKTAYENARAVYENYNSTQEEIDSALANLQTAYNSLEGNEFVEVGTLSLMSSGTELVNNAMVTVDSNSEAVISASFADGAMVKSKGFTFENANGVFATLQDNGTLLVKKTTIESIGTIDVTYTVVDDYDRETTITRTLRLVDKVVNISNFKFVYNEEEVESVTYQATSLTGKTVQLGINTYPENADAYKSISWTSSNSRITVDENGLVKMGTASVTTSNYSSTITCTITLNDGSTVKNTIVVTFTR